MGPTDGESSLRVRTDPQSGRESTEELTGGATPNNGCDERVR